MPVQFSVSTLNVIVAVVSVVLSAGATLGITLYFSLESAHYLALDNVHVMADKARDQMVSFVSMPLARFAALQYSINVGDDASMRVLPSETWNGVLPWHRAFESLCIQIMKESEFRYQYALLSWADGFYVGCKTIPGVSELFQCRTYSRVPTSPGSILLERNFSKESGDLVGEATSASRYDPRQRSWYAMIKHEPNMLRFSDVYLSAMPTLPVVDLHAVLHNKTTFLGIGGTSYELQELDTELKRLTPSTSGGTTILLDNMRGVLGSSMQADSYSKISVPRGYVMSATEAANKCILSDAQTATLSILVCQKTIHTFDFKPLRALASNYPHLLVAPTQAQNDYVPQASDPRPTPHVAVYTLDDTKYYVAVIALTIPRASNMNWLIVSFLPASLVTSEINKGRDVAIGVVAGLVVAVAILVALLVKLMLNPLSQIASRMETAAYLRVRGGGMREKGDTTSSGDDSSLNPREDDIDHQRLREKAREAEEALIKERKISYLSDVAAIQNAYWDMADELWALKGYIPEHVTNSVIAKIAARRAEQNGLQTPSSGPQYSSGEGGGGSPQQSAGDAAGGRGGRRLRGSAFSSNESAKERGAVVNRNVTKKAVDRKRNGLEVSGHEDGVEMRTTDKSSSNNNSSGGSAGINQANLETIQTMTPEAVIAQLMPPHAAAQGTPATQQQQQHARASTVPVFSPAEGWNERNENGGGGEEPLEQVPAANLALAGDMGSHHGSQHSAFASNRTADNGRRRSDAHRNGQGDDRSASGHEILSPASNGGREGLYRDDALAGSVVTTLENVSVAANRIAGLAKVEDDVPIFFGDNVLVDRDITIVHFNIVNFHKYCRVTHGKDLKQEHEAFVNLIYTAARKCGGVLDTFSGDKFFVSFNAASRCVDHPVAAVGFAHEVSTIVTKDAIWGTRRRRIEQEARMNNVPPPKDGKSFPPHVYKSAPFGVTCGVATGRAFVGPLGSERILRHSVLSNAMTESVALERLCLRYPACRVLIAGDLITMVEGYFAYQLLDAAVLPGTQGKRRRIASVKGPLFRSNLGDFRGGCRVMAAKSRKANIYKDMNDCFIAFLEGRSENCLSSLLLLDEKVQRESVRLQALMDEEQSRANQQNANAQSNAPSPRLMSSKGPLAAEVPSTLAGGKNEPRELPMTNEECADMVIMSQFLRSLLQCQPLDGRLYRSPLGEIHQPVQHALYLVPPKLSDSGYQSTSSASKEEGNAM